VTETRLKCVRCYRRKPRTDFRETPWHGRAAACQSCERFTFWDLHSARAQWQLEQARETARGLRRGLRLVRAARLRRRYGIYVYGQKEPIRWL
jgi:hypothetical protein